VVDVALENTPRSEHVLLADTRGVVCHVQRHLTNPHMDDHVIDRVGTHEAECQEDRRGEGEFGQSNTARVVGQRAHYAARKGGFETAQAHGQFPVSTLRSCWSKGWLRSTVDASSRTFSSIPIRPAIGKKRG